MLKFMNKDITIIIELQLDFNKKKAYFNNI